MDQWLSEIAVSPTEPATSISFLEILEQAVELADNPTPWKESWLRWMRSSLISKFKAVIAIIKHRRPPWEIRVTARSFQQILGAFDCEVEAVYEINHVDKEVIFLKFAGLPGGHD